MTEEDLRRFFLEEVTNGKIIGEPKKGASGSVYIIDQDGWKTAYKTIRIDKISEEKKKHFIEECEIWLKIQSNYIATAFYPKIIGDDLFIVMPFFDCSLQSFLVDVANNKKIIDYIDGLVIACKITKALIELKRCGIEYHQDFNPPNILIQLLDKKFKDFPTENYINYDIKIADFGMANLRDRIGPTIGGEGGKFSYKAPEQYYPKKYVAYNPDIFALGIMTYMIFSGKHPDGTDNKKALKSKSEIKNWILSENKNIKSLENTDLQNYINRMLQNDPAERPNLDDFYAFILGELKKNDLSVHTQLVGFFDYMDVFDVTGDKIDKLYRLCKVAEIPEYEDTVFDELYKELDTTKSNLKNIEDVVYYSELMRYLNRFFKKGYLQQDKLKEEYIENVSVLHKWYNKIKLSDCYKKIHIPKELKEYEAANGYISFAIEYLSKFDTVETVEAYFKKFNDKVFLSHFYYYNAICYHQTDIYKTLDFLSKAKENHPTESLFYCKEGKWIKQFLMLEKHNMPPVSYKLCESQKEELKIKMQIAFEYCKSDRFV